MYAALKTPSFFRPSSRPPSPIPPTRQDTVMSLERAPRPLSKLSLSTFRRPSPSPATGLTPATVVQDGSYMEVLSLKLSEAVSKALAQSNGPPVPHELLAGRRPIPPGRGRSLGALIASEIKASRENPHLYRAIIRTLQRPLSVLLTNLSSNLLPLLSSPLFLTPPSPTTPSPHLNATQLHAVGLATLAGELLEAFDEIGLGIDIDTRGESLKTIREGLVSIVKRVVDPLTTSIKNELTPVIEALESALPPCSSAHTAGAKGSGGTKSPVAHPSIMTLQTVMPVYARALTRIIASASAESALASLLISLTWRGLVALTNRPPPLPSPPSSPSVGPSALKAKDPKRPSPTPPVTPPASRFTLKLPPSRPPSPPSITTSRGPTVAADAHAFYTLLSLLPRPSGDKESTQLAHEAVDEAFEGLSALVTLLDAVQSHMSIRNRPNVPGPPASPALMELEHDLEVLTADLPLLIALPILLRTYCAGERHVTAMLGLSEVEYRKGCLGGYGRAEECAVAVGQRVLDVLQAEGAVAAVGPAGRTEVLMRWLSRQLVTESANNDH